MVGHRRVGLCRVLFVACGRCRWHESGYVGYVCLRVWVQWIRSRVEICCVPGDLDMCLLVGCLGGVSVFGFCAVSE